MTTEDPLEALFDASPDEDAAAKPVEIFVSIQIEGSDARGAMFRLDPGFPERYDHPKVMAASTALNIGRVVSRTIYQHFYPDEEAQP